MIHVIQYSMCIIVIYVVTHYIIYRSGSRTSCSGRPASTCAWGPAQVNITITITIMIVIIVNSMFIIAITIDTTITIITTITTNVAIIRMAW